MPDFSGLATLLQRMQAIQPIPNWSGGAPPLETMPITPATPQPTLQPMRTPYYLASPSAPLSYMMPGAPWEEDPEDRVNRQAAERINSLISGMEPYPQPAPPPQRSAGSKILGILGDALANYGSVRAGGPTQPIGPYGSTIQGERVRFESAKDEAAKNNAAIRNQMRLAAFQKEEDRRTRLEEARIRSSAPNRGMRTANETRNIGIFGIPTLVTFIRDPMSGDVLRVQIGGQDVSDDPEIMAEIAKANVAYAPAAGVPGIQVGANGERTAGLFNIPKTPGGKAIAVALDNGARLEPQPTVSYAEKVGGAEGVLTGFPALMQSFTVADSAARKASSGGIVPDWLDPGVNYTKAKIGASEIGPAVPGIPTETINYYRNIWSVLIPYVRQASGLTVPEKEYKRYESRFPKPGVDTPEEAMVAWRSVVGEIVRDMRGLARQAGKTPPPLPPELAWIEQGAAAPASSGLTFEDAMRRLDEKRNAQPAP